DLEVRRKAPAEPGGDHRVADADLVGAQQVLDAALVVVGLAGAAQDAARAGALHDDVHSAALVDREHHVGVAILDARDLADQALGADHRHALDHAVVTAAVDADADHAEQRR